jgi:hypothetical protein
MPNKTSFHICTSDPSASSSCSEYIAAFLVSLQVNVFRFLRNLDQELLGRRAAALAVLGQRARTRTWAGLVNKPAAGGYMLLLSVDTSRLAHRPKDPRKGATKLLHGVLFVFLCHTHFRFQ